ncbi:hypothetical protein IJ818_06955 [bacterium]|nr:hypothetical protein [bacterium]
MIGDTFSHRTQVPVVYSGKNSKNKYYFNCTETVNNKSEHLFNTKTVKFTTNTDKQNILDTAQETDFLANTPSMRSINHLRKAVSLGVVEFRDIKKYSYRYFNNEKGPICHAYEDNPNFYTRRYDEAMYACDAFMISGFDDQFYYTDLAPTENENGTFVKLWEFKRYAYESHCDLSDLPKNDWNKNTSIPKIVDDNGNIVYKYSKEKY